MSEKRVVYNINHHNSDLKFEKKILRVARTIISTKYWLSPYFVFKNFFFLVWIWIFCIDFAASTVPDSSEDELLEKQPPPKVKKLPTPASESPRKSRMGPKKSALAQVSASQDEDETMNDTDLMPTTKGK